MIDNNKSFAYHIKPSAKMGLIMASQPVSIDKITKNIEGFGRNLFFKSVSLKNKENFGIFWRMPRGYDVFSRWFETFNIQRNLGVFFGQGFFHEFWTIGLVNEGCNVSPDYFRGTTAPVNCYQANFNTILIQRINFSNATNNLYVTDFESWPVVRNKLPIKQAELKSTHDHEKAAKNHKKIIDPVFLNIEGINIKGININRRDPYGCGFLFILFCYLAGLCLIAFGNRLILVFLGIGITLIGTLTMAFSAFPWDWSFAWFCVFVCGA